MFGENGMLVSENPTPTSVSRHTAASTSARARLHHFFIDRYAESYLLEIDAFVDAIESGTAPLPSFEDGRRALVLADAAVESAATGRSVRIGR